MPTANPDIFDTLDEERSSPKDIFDAIESAPEESTPPEREPYVAPPRPLPPDMSEFSRGTPDNPYGVATPEERAFTTAQPSEFDRPLIPPGVFKTALDIGSATLPRTELVEGFKEGAAEQLAGMTSQSSAAMLPAFAIPYVGPALAMGMGAKAVGSGAGTVTGALEGGNLREAGSGLSEVAGGALMLGGGAMAARPAIPPRIAAVIERSAQDLPKAAAAAVRVAEADRPIDISTTVEPITKGVEDARSLESPATLHGDVRPFEAPAEVVPAKESSGGILPREEPAAARESARAQGGEEGEVLLTAPEVIKSIESLSDESAGALKQKPAVEAGMKLTEADVPALEAARDAAAAEGYTALEANDNVKSKAAMGRNIYFSGLIEGARRKGPNYDFFIKEKAQSGIDRQPAGNNPQIEAGGTLEATANAGQKNTPGSNREALRNREAELPRQEMAQRASGAPILDRPDTGGATAGTPGNYGANAGAEVAPVRVRTPQEQQQLGQPTGKSGVNELVNAPETPRTTETAPTPAASGAGAPPIEPPPTPPAAPGAPPPPGTPRATLDDVYKIFEPAPKTGKTIGERASGALESVRTGFSSKFRPLNKLAEDVASAVGGTAKDVAGIFEQLKGSSGKAEAEVYRFDKDVSDAVKGSEKDFNAYMFLRRSLDRLNQDAADIARAQAGEDVPNLNRRRVSQYTIPQLEAKLATLSEQIGGEKLAGFSKAADAYQTHMDQALRLQVESGRMSPEVYDDIKSGNQFYAPFKVMKYIEESMRPEGSGRRVDTAADYVKAMEGIEDPNFKLGDMLAAARQNLTLSRTLAEKNRAMQNITELAALDVDGNFVRKLKPGEDAPSGMEAVNVLENGQKQRYSVNKDVAEAIGALGPRSANLLMRLAASTFRAGATTFNLPFQISNILADTPRAALVSKYGINIIPELVLYPFDVAYAKAKGIPVEQINNRLARSAVQSLRFPLSLLEGIYSSFTGEVGGMNNKLMLDFLESGTAGTTFQEYLTPGSLRQPKSTTGSKALDIGKSVLKTPGAIAQAVEQINKVGGVAQAMRAHGVESGKALPSEAITELRRFSGSPDFGRMGKWVENYGLNLAQMFLNARIQGAVADVGRLTGRDGLRQAAATWINLGAWVGLPSLYLYMLNNRDKEAQDNYAARPKQEKQNYWLVPKTDDDGKQRYIKGANGESVPDYWRIPKRESAKWTGNFVEAGLEFAKAKDPETFKNWSVGLLEDISPLNVQGKSLTERVESVASGLNPLLKAPLETATGRDTYRHRNIVPDSQKKASPEQQYTDRTAEVFKSLATAMPDVAPEVFRSPLMLENLTKNFTAGLLTQFLPRQPVEGRSKVENLPLAQRFQALPYTDSSEFDERIQKFERESADEQLKRLRDAKAIIDGNKGAKPDVLIQQMIEKHGRDPKLAERIVDLYVAEQRGITTQERRVLALPVTQRAEYLADELKGKTPEQKAVMLRNWALKRILTERVGAELAPRLAP